MVSRTTRVQFYNFFKNSNKIFNTEGCWVVLVKSIHELPHNDVQILQRKATKDNRQSTVNTALYISGGDSVDAR